MKYCCEDFKEYFGKLTIEELKEESVNFCPFCGKKVLIDRSNNE